MVFSSCFANVSHMIQSRDGVRAFHVSVSLTEVTLLRSGIFSEQVNRRKPIPNKTEGVSVALPFLLHSKRTVNTVSLLKFLTLQ